MFKGLHPNIRARIMIQFLSKIVGTMVFPFMAIYFTRELNSGLAGILVMSNVIIQFLAGLYGGHLTDLYGRHRLMICGEWLKTGAYFGMLLANSPFLQDPWLTFAMMLLVSIAQGLINPAADAMLIDVSTPENRSFMYAISYWANNLSSLIGVMIGGWFFQSHLSWLLAGLCLLSLLTTGLTIKKLTETLPAEQRKNQRAAYSFVAVFSSYRKVAADRRFLLFTLGGIAVMAIEFQRNNFISVRLAEEISSFQLQLGFFGSPMLDGVRLLSILTAINTLMIVLFTAPVAKWLGGKSRFKWLYFGFGLFGLGFALTAVLNNFILLAAATILYSLGELFYVPMRQTTLADMVDDSQRGTYMAFNGLINQAGRIMASLSLMIAPVLGNFGMFLLIFSFGLLAILFTKQSLRMPVVSREKELWQKVDSSEF